MKAVELRSTAPPSQILRIQYGIWSYYTLKAAVQLNVFSALADGQRTAKDAATLLKVDLRGLEILYDALVGLELLIKTGKSYELNEISRTYLLPDSDLSMVQYIIHAQELAKRWDLLPEAIRTGKSVSQVNDEAQAAEFFPALAEAIFPMSYAIATKVAATLSEVNKGSVRILDFAAGSGVWSIPFAQLNEAARVDALDFPSVLEITRKVARRHGVLDRYSYISGNWRDVPWEKSAYDIILLGHILHSEGREVSLELLKQCHSALKKGGLVVVPEFVSNDEKTGPVAPLLFALNMFAMTSAGCVFTHSELTDILEQAGFSNVKPIYDEPAACTVVTAVK